MNLLICPPKRSQHRCLTGICRDHRAKASSELGVIGIVHHGLPFYVYLRRFADHSSDHRIHQNSRSNIRAKSAPRAKQIGKVRIQAASTFPPTRQRTADKRRLAPTPIIAVLMV
jgi:hypothetical protein